MNLKDKNFSMYLPSEYLKKAGYRDWIKGYLLAMIPTVLIGFFPLFLILLPIAMKVQNTFVPMTGWLGIPILLLLFLMILITASASLALTSLIVFKYVSSIPIVSLLIQNSLLGILLLLNLRNFYLNDLTPFVIFNNIILYLLLIAFTYLAMRLVVGNMTKRLKNH
jgi:hypothetical protein